MTKPSYEELERKLKSVKDALFNLQADRETRTGREQRLTAELARVRGLLQRGIEFVQPEACTDSFCRDIGHVKVKKWLAEAKAGAESADIGKLENTQTAIVSTIVNKNAGSAETGGEKAVCKHERLNADGACDCGYWVGNPSPGPESREPEKLNNAQKCANCGHEDLHEEDGIGCLFRGKVDGAHICNCETKSVALAESSLSSPPHPDDE